MRREVHVRFCERLAVTFRGPTLPGCRSAGALLAEEGPGKVPEPAVLAKLNSSPDTSVTVGSAATVGLRSARDSLRADLARHASHSDQKT
jgi:hypothetical protein